jgi:hypothetical protein
LVAEKNLALVRAGETERIARPEVPGARDDESAHVDAGLVESVLAPRLRCGIVVGGAMEQKSRPVAVDRRIAYRRRVEIDPPVLHRRRAEEFLGDLVG